MGYLKPAFRLISGILTRYYPFYWTVSQNFKKVQLFRKKIFPKMDILLGYFSDIQIEKNIYTYILHYFSVFSPLCCQLFVYFSSTTGQRTTISKTITTTNNWWEHWTNLISRKNLWNCTKILIFGICSWGCCGQLFVSFSTIL